MKDTIEAVRALAVEFGLGPSEITGILIFLVVCFFLGKGVKFGLDRVTQIFNINATMQKQLSSELQASYLVIQEQQKYIVTLRSNKQKLLERIDHLELRIEENDERIRTIKRFLVAKGLADEAWGL